jgi:hypothetical protein
MKDVDLKKLGTLRLCGGGALVALATWGVWAFCNGGFSAPGGCESAFDGWQYGREDQKTASAALAAAGLDEWSWDDGRLLVPKNKKNEYQIALAEAGAYPKAPSESRRDAIREMGAFESEAKIRMRELDACAFQLERTLERAGGIEYATVGVRARREQAGLTSKTVVTASIGVACREGRELDANLLSAITVAAKHQLGVDANENISILDLKAGKSYFGSETLVGNGNDLLLAAEKERVETYWRDKLLKTFDYMGGARVSVAADLVVVDANEDLRTELDGALIDGGDFHNVDEQTGKVASVGRAASAAERLAQVEIGSAGEIGKPRPLATWDGDVRKSARNGGAFARLGNPVATRSPAPVEAQNLAQVERKTEGNGVLQVGASERKNAPKRGVAPAGYRQEAEGEANGAVEGGAQTVKEEASQENKTDARSETVAQNAKKKETGENKSDGAGKKVAVEKGERVRFRVRALAVRVGTPRGYVRRVAQNLKAENAVETFATDETSGSWSALYRTTEQKIIAETKKVALLLLRPLAERNGWTENELTRSVAVDVFADPNDFTGAWARDARNGDGAASGAYEVIANFGQMAETAERIAEETTIDAPTASETSEKPTNETPEEETTADFWALWKERASRMDPKTKAGGAAGVGVLAILMLATVATARRRKKTGVAFDETNEKKATKDAKQTLERTQEKKRKKQDGRNASTRENELDGDGENENENGFGGAFERTERQDRGNRTTERNLRIARIEEKTATAQNAEVDEETRRDVRETETRNLRQNPQIRRFMSAAQDGVGGNLETERRGNENLKENDRFNDYSDYSDCSDSDDWDDLDDDLLEIRSLIERERARVDGETGESSGNGAPKNGGDATRRREALDLVARNPERAAASLERWLRPGA